jgi:hypothetical protein
MSMLYKWVGLGPLFNPSELPLRGAVLVYQNPSEMNIFKCEGSRWKQL